MNAFNKLSILGLTVLTAVSIGTVRAEQGDVTQTRTQEQTRLNLNLQTPNADFGQAQNREERTVMNKNQNQYQNKYQHQNQYQHQNNFQLVGSDSANSSAESMNRGGNIWQGSNTSSNSMDRMNTGSRSMQGSSAASSMSRQGSAGRSMGGGGGGRR